MQDEIPEFNIYTNTPIFHNLGEIRSFTLVIEIPPIKIWSDAIFAYKIAERIYEQLRDVVRAAGFYHEHELRIVREGNRITVEFDDDQYAFTVSCLETQIRIYRPGSNLFDFHHWYKALMPSAQGIITNITSVLTEELDRKIDILRLFYQFIFIVYDIVPDSAGANTIPVRNSEIMQKLLHGFPDDQGLLTPAPSVLGSMGRVDVGISRWIGQEGRRRLMRFLVEAPGNKNWSTLWFTFDYIGESYTSPDTGERDNFDADSVLAEFDSVYTTFLRDSAINGFMDSLLRGYYFQSTSGNIP